MASSINASVSGAGGLISTADNSGILNLQSAGTTVAALASTGLAVTGTLSASGAITATGGLVVGAAAAPAFRAYRSGNQTISANVTTKVAFNAETFDTNSNYDPTTNFRFTPTVAGYYQINSTVAFTTGSGQLALYKNGINYQTGSEVTYNGLLGGHIPINDLVYLNGSTDYVEIYVYLTSGTTISSGETNTSFSASMVRSA